MADKTFTRAGISTSKGKTRFRFTNDPKRERVLEKADHTDIRFYELDQPMTKEQATEFLVAQGHSESGAPVAKPVSAPAASTTESKRHTAPERADSKSAPAKKQTALCDEDSAEFKRLVAEKRQSFPSHTEEQVLEIARFQARAALRHFGTIEVPF